MNNHTLSLQIIRKLIANGFTVATAESCTGGGIAAALTSINGSSACVQGGVVAYAVETKRRILGVHMTTINRHGVVSEPVVLEMAYGAAQALHADFAVSTSGISGPTGGTPENPVGTVWIAVVRRGGPAVTFRLTGDDLGRSRNTSRAVNTALEMLLDFVEKELAK